MLACADPPTTPAPAPDVALGGLRAERARLIRTLREVDELQSETDALQDQLAEMRAEVVRTLRAVEQRIRDERQGGPPEG